MWNYSKISKNLKTNGYYEFNNYLSKIEIKKVQNTLLQTLNYIRPSNQKNLQKKYYEIKKYNNKLKGNWYDICKYNIDLLQILHKKEMIILVKKFFNTNVVFSGRPAIHVHDIANDRILDAHQETNQFARDTLVLWIPLFDTNEKTGGIKIYSADEEWNLLGHHFSAQAYWVDIFLSKIDRYAVSEEALKTYDSMLQAFTTYLCQFGNITIPFRAKKRYLSAELF